MQFIAVYVVLSNNLRDRLYGYIMVAWYNIDEIQWDNGFLVVIAS